MAHKYYLIYKITNKSTGKYYIGKHKTNKIDDGYMGSGSEIQFAIFTEGKENFEKEILFTFNNEQDMIEKEKELVNEEFVALDNTYNKAVAGGATWAGLRGPKDLHLYEDVKFRPICPICKKYPVTVNYRRKGKIHYRTMCSNCNHRAKRQKDATVQLLIKSGYIKKTVCDRCNFISKHPAQMNIVYLDGNRHNVSRTNLRTYCSNCMIELKYSKIKKVDLVPDY